MRTRTCPDLPLRGGHWEAQELELLGGRHDSAGYELNLNGPLMEKVVISGAVLGSEAAIYISENALVSSLEVQSGALIAGDIVSHWDPSSPDIEDYVKDRPDEFDLYTHLIFRAGESRGSADPDILLAGSIKGSESFKMQIAGGSMNTLGSIEVYSLENHGALAVYGQNEDGYAIQVQDELTLASDSSLTLPFSRSLTANKIAAETLEA